MSRKAREKYLSPMLRKVRKGGKDTARCFLTTAGVKKEIYLGYWGTPEADDKYRQIASEFYANGDVQGEAEKNVATLAYLYAQFLQDADRRVADPRQKFDKRELRHYECVIRYTIPLYANLPLKNLNATVYRTIRDHFVSIAPEVVKEGPVKKKAWTANGVNKLMTYFRLIIRWGIGRDLLDPSVMDRFSCVEPLVSDLPVKDPRTDVDDDVVRQTLPYMSPTVRDMVIIQRTHGLRPSAVCDLKVGDIDMSGKVWTVTKEDKTTWRTRIPLIIKFGPEDQRILRPRLSGRNPDENVFSPQVARLERREEERQRRNPKRAKKWTELSDEELARKYHKSFYNVERYDQAVRRAIRSARKHGIDIPDWCPYQLRHTAVTVTAYLHGRDKAMLLAGHKSLTMTDHYAHEASRVKEDLALSITPYWIPDEVTSKQTVVRSVADSRKKESPSRQKTE